MSENHREPEVPEEEVSVVECFDGLARITLEELAITHFVKDGTLQNACSTRPRVVVGFGKSAHSHIVRLMNSQAKGQKIMMKEVCSEEAIREGPEESTQRMEEVESKKSCIIVDQIAENR